MRNEACIIGAGSSGIAAAKVFAERGIPFDGFEMGSEVGGLWRYENETGRSPAYRSLRANTSRDKTAYSGFPMPAHYPDYPSHEQMLAYFEAYADRFDLREHFRFRSRVTSVRPTGDGTYEVSWRSLDDDSGPSLDDDSGPPLGDDSGPPLDDDSGHPLGASERSSDDDRRSPDDSRRSLDDAVHVGRYGAVVVASGHHWKPHRPRFPGVFAGRELHSRDYRTPDDLAGRRVLVVGIGNSGCDIVCEVSRVADQTFHSTRRSAHVIPKYLLGRPVDHWLSPLTARLPFAARRALFKLLIFLERGRQSKYGLREPDHDLGSEHPTISTDLLPLVRDGSITPKPNVEELQGDRVWFADDSVEEIDVIIYATGYLTAFPFLDFVEVEDNEFPLFHHVVHPSWTNLFFLGLVQPLGAIPPLVEAQSEWIADLLEGRAALPSEEEMHGTIREQEASLRRRFVDSKRHRMEVEMHPYFRELRRERRKGRRHAPRQAIARRALAEAGPAGRGDT